MNHEKGRWTRTLFPLAALAAALLLSGCSSVVVRGPDGDWMWRYATYDEVTGKTKPPSEVYADPEDAKREAGFKNASDELATIAALEVKWEEMRRRAVLPQADPDEEGDSDE